MEQRANQLAALTLEDEEEVKKEVKCVFVIGTGFDALQLVLCSWGGGSILKHISGMVIFHIFFPIICYLLRMLLFKWVKNESPAGVCGN